MFHANFGEKAGRRFIYGFRQGDHHGGAWKNQEVQRTGQVVPNEPMRAAPQPARVAAVLCTKPAGDQLLAGPRLPGNKYAGRGWRNETNLSSISKVARLSPMMAWRGMPWRWGSMA